MEKTSKIECYPQTPGNPRLMRRRILVLMHKRGGSVNDIEYEVSESAYLLIALTHVSQILNI
jgi:hypothetical protein